jgi:hypothetical protein
MRMLSKLIAVVTIPVMLTGCSGAIKVAQYATKPKITFASPASWNCDQEVKVPGKWREVETCQRCINIGKGPEGVTINDQSSSITPKRSVLVCSTQAMVE